MALGEVQCSVCGKAPCKGIFKVEACPEFAVCSRCNLEKHVLCNAITHQRLAICKIKEALKVLSKSGKSANNLDKFHRSVKEAIHLLDEVEKEAGVDLDAE